MKPLYTKHQFQSAKSRDLLKLQCKYCGNSFYRSKNIIQIAAKKGKHTADFCSSKCHKKSRKKITKFICLNCGTSIELVGITQYNRKFCSRSCSVSYNNTHKTHGTRTSKLELWLQKKLIELYPDLEFHFNRKDTINSELDIYIPSLKLAFELNGIFHYEPIYGEDKLHSIQNNDHRKILACAEKGIGLCVIDTSSFTYFKEQNAQKYLDIINNILSPRQESNLGF